MAASGIAASMSSTAETCCPPAHPAARPCHDMPKGPARFDVPVVQLIRPARTAKMAGWSNAAAVSASSSAACAIRPVPGKRRFQVVTGQRSPNHDAEPGPDPRCTIVPNAVRNRYCLGVPPLWRSHALPLVLAVNLSSGPGVAPRSRRVTYPVVGRLARSSPAPVPSFHAQ